MDLSPADIEFFSNQDNWRYGPMYELWMYFPMGISSEYIEYAVVAAGRLVSWNAVEHPKTLKSIMPIAGLPSIGVVHWYRRKPHKDKNLCAYSLAVYPPQYRRALGLPIQGKEDGEERWHEMEQSRVFLFHKALFRVIDGVSANLPMIGASIQTEDCGMIAPYTEDGSVCVSPNVAAVLKLESVPLPNSYGYFVSLRRDETAE